MKETNKEEAYIKVCDTALNHISALPGLEEEWEHYMMPLDGKLKSRQRKFIYSGGYVVDTLTAAVWCLLKYDTFEDTVLAAVNLGDDTDTTAAVAGGLAGIYYGIDAIPDQWIKQLARLNDIMKLVGRFADFIITKEATPA
jgi:hypothetical protein